MGGAVQPPRTRQLKKTFQNLVLTVVCGLTTVLVLRGSSGFVENPPSIIPTHHIAEEYPALYFFTKHHRPPTKSDTAHAHFITYRHRPLHHRDLVTNHYRPSHKSQIPHFPTANHHQPSYNSELPITGSELPHSRLLAEAHDLTQSLPHAQSTEKAKDPLSFDNPDPNLSLISTKPNSKIHLSDTNQIDSTGSSYQLRVVSMDWNPNQIITEASVASQDHDESDAFDRNLRKSGEEVLQSHSASLYQPSILLVTGSQPFACANPMGDYYLTKSLKNKMDYCRLHNLDIFYNMANLNPQMSGFWAKLPLIYTLMQAHPETEWFWWIDSGALITDMAFELPMDRYKDYNLVLHGWKELVYEEKTWVGLNTGSFLIRNCEWSLNLIEEWAPMGSKGKAREEAGHFLFKALEGRPDFEADDQSALIYLLNEQREKWADKVYLENAYYLHGYWSIIVERYEEMMERYHSGLGDERWPFVTHFVGCKPCTNNNKKLALQGKCLEHMERAFNFADNQVLQIYGFQHEALNTHRVLQSISSS